MLTDYVANARMYRGDGPLYLEDTSKPESEFSACARYYIQLIREDIAAYQKRPIEGVTYEDIANVCVQLDKETGTRRNAALWPYRRELFSRIKKRFPNTEAGHLEWDAVDRIRWAVRYRFLECRDRPAALENFSRTVLSQFVSATIVTLNHDLYLEQVLGKRVRTGFRQDVSGREFFHPDALANKSGLQLLKLHGSIDWFWDADSGRYERILTSGWLDVASAPILLAGTLSKMEDYSYGIFPWLWAEFQNALRQTRRVIVSGYGFKDVGMNTRLKSWLDHFPTARLLIIHPKPDSLFEETRLQKVDAVRNFFDDTSVVTLGRDESRPEQRVVFLPVGFESSTDQDGGRLIAKFTADDVG